MTRWTLRRAGWGLLLGALGVSCGAAFRASPAEGEDPPVPEAGAGPGGRGGEAASGAPAGGLQGEGGAAGVGGSPAPLSCDQLGGVALSSERCYVDVTPATSPTQAEAVAACAALASELDRPAHLLVLNDLVEQSFIIRQFLAELTDVSDAWLGLTCSEEAHPNAEDCFCKDCSAEDLSQRQQAWSWLDGTSASFGWINGNPNAADRCAALAYNPTPGINVRWGWVDRPCEKGWVTPLDGHPHDYRVVCEVPF